MEKNPRFNLKFGSTYKNWKLDLLEQVVECDTDFYVLLQEDHLPQIDFEDFKVLLRDIESNDVDYLPLSFHPHYARSVDNLRKLEDPKVVTETLEAWDLENSFKRTLGDIDTIYPISLIGVFSSRLLVKLLSSERPYWKTYSIETPFGFEQNHKQDWFLPIRWGFPRNEVLACYDDDHGIKNYSLVSRDKYPISTQREIDHHVSNVFFKFRIGETLMRKYLYPRIPPNIIVFPRNFVYTLKSMLSIWARRKAIKFLLCR